MSVPETMTAIVASMPGGPDVLIAERRPVPSAGPGELLVRVAAAGVNRPDVSQRKGSYPPPPGAPDILGLEIAGEVVALGPEVTRFQVGDAVMALVPGGGYAEYAVVQESNALRIPTGFSMVEAAAVPETYFTVWLNVFMRGHLQPGELLLVHGGTSGIGTTAIQLARALGSRVIATAGSASKCDACRSLGAEVAINYREQDFVTETKAATANRGADVILDMVGGDYVARNYEAAAVDGRIVQIAFLQDSNVAFNMRDLTRKRLTHTGSTLRPQSVSQKAVIARALEQSVLPLFAQGRAKPVIDSVFPLRDVARAHERIESSEHIGKIVLQIS
jgi:NADPH2:quinone reductase